jgi:hypothetical protein
MVVAHRTHLHIQARLPERLVIGLCCQHKLMLASHFRLNLRHTSTESAMTVLKIPEYKKTAEEKQDKIGHR